MGKKDPVGTVALDPNLYAYVVNNPLSYTDPSGEHPLAWLLGKIASWLGLKPLDPQWPREEMDDDKDGTYNFQDPDSEFCRINCRRIPPPQPPSNSQYHREY